MTDDNFKPVRNDSKLEKNKRMTGWVLVIIPSLLIILFYIYPMFKAFWTSLNSGAGVNLIITYVPLKMTNLKQQYLIHLYI